ncbi:putative Ribosomal biogenesis protein LAS1L [Cocos nucifera]|nr:putative Ribosomal biogenesis protein LAS1L [Cocos nucifera]
METMGSEGELSSGYKLVPWSSWDQWNFVRESIFSSSPDSVAAALRRISAWRGRGCLPAPIEITAAFVEIQQKDPFFRKAPMDDALSSEEMLSMLYSMAITSIFVAL